MMYPNRSLIEKYLWNGIRSESLLIPKGLLEPVWCKNIIWTIATAINTNGNMKCSAKNRFSVALSTANPPQIHSTRDVPKYGIAENKLVITVAPQNLICPHGNTYPINAVAIVRIYNTTPMFHVSIIEYDP